MPRETELTTRPQLPPTGGASPWIDLNAYIGLPRLQSLVLSPDGQSLLVSVSSLDADRTGYVSAWWRVDPHGVAAARRHTRSVEGESTAAFTSAGDLLFTSARPAPPAGAPVPDPPGPKSEPTAPDSSGDPSAETDPNVVWCLPGGGGEAYPLARRNGGWEGIATARQAEVAVFSAGYHVGTSTEAEDQARRASRKKNKINAILHEGYPVRYWDHDLNRTDTRLFAVRLGGAEPLDLDPRSDDLTDLTGTTRGIGGVQAVAADGSFALVTQQVRERAGWTVERLIEVDLHTGEATVRADEQGYGYGDAVLSDDGRWIVCRRESDSTPTSAPRTQLWLIDRESGEGRVLASEWDRWPSPVAFDPAGQTVYAVADEDQRSPIFAVDVASGAVTRLSGDGAFSAVRRSPDGGTLYALRTSYTDPGSVVAVATADGSITELPSPTNYPELPGDLVEVETTTEDGVQVRGLLARPTGASADQPAPLALWIHGGPLGSWNSWSWRWCPWLMVARGYAVLLPDPALSTGYGQEFVQRGWGSWGGAPYTDLMAITDEVEQRSDVDATATIAMGGSFGGYMANWVAGHTDRFAGIVSHASLWNLESFGPTTDAAWYWGREMTPEMMRENSPHRFADKIRTPMLVIHGDKDYRVPISEGIALWWALVSGFDGPSEELPHKFLYFPDENHWVLSPQHAIVWYETVLAFCESARTGGNFVRPETL